MGIIRRGQSVWPFVLVLLLGAIAGTLVGEALRSAAPVLAQSRTLGFHLNDLNLAGLLRLNFGFTVNISLGTILGALVGAFIGRRL